jgi:hypothetical protein
MGHPLLIACGLLLVLGYPEPARATTFRVAYCSVDVEVGVGSTRTPTPTDTPTTEPSITTETPTPTLPANEIPTLTPSPSPGIACRLIPGQVDFGSLDTVPAQPRVGDQVELRFSVSFRVYSVNSVSVEAAAPLFVGDMRHEDGVTTFQLMAVSEGTTTVRLSVEYATEEACDDGFGGTFFQVGPDQIVTSFPYPLVVGPAAATPTPTFSPTATHESTSSDSSGCAIDGNGRGTAWWLAPLLVLLRARRRPVRCSEGRS